MNTNRDEIEQILTQISINAFRGEGVKWSWVQYCDSECIDWDDDLREEWYSLRKKIIDNDAILKENKITKSSFRKLIKESVNDFFNDKKRLKRLLNK